MSHAEGKPQLDAGEGKDEVERKTAEMPGTKREVPWYHSIPSTTSNCTIWISQKCSQEGALPLDDDNHQQQYSRCECREYLREQMNKSKCHTCPKLQDQVYIKILC